MKKIDKNKNKNKDKNDKIIKRIRLTVDMNLGGINDPCINDSSLNSSLNKSNQSLFSSKESDGADLNLVKKILRDVKLYGDDAVLKYSIKFDQFDKSEFKGFELTKNQIKDAYANVSLRFIKLMKDGLKNIKFFAKMQKKQFGQFKNMEIKRKDIILGHKIIPIQRVGCYVPGGRYPLPSSALLSVATAKAAGVDEIILCSPKIKPETIVAGDMAGANRIFNIGGVQAIAAMAYGTKTVPKVDKIVGPGNKYVTAAKKEVYGAAGIDFIAGPSEVMIIADDSGNAKLIAADLLAQAEHDPCSSCILVTTSVKLADKVESEIKDQLIKLKTKEIAAKALGSNNSAIILVKSLKDGVMIANKKAPEHLELQVKNPSEIIKRLKNYGSMFIGNKSAEVFGDYCSGPNHILPTNGAARYTGGLSVADFVKIQSYQKILNPTRLKKLAASFADAEGLDGHKKAALFR